MEYQTFQHVARNGITGLILCARVILYQIGNTLIGHNQKRVRAKVVDNIIRYESGLMEEEDVILFFQELINTGMAWKLQGHYGRTAMHLIETGLCENTNV